MVNDIAKLATALSACGVTDLTLVRTTGEDAVVRGRFYTRAFEVAIPLRVIAQDVDTAAYETFCWLKEHHGD